MENINEIKNKMETKEGVPKIRILVIEDQFYPQWNILNSIKKNLGEMVENFENEKDITLITNFSDAEKILEKENFDFQLIFLDNKLVIDPIDISRMKREDVKICGKNSQITFTLYDEPEDYSDIPKTDGYILIEKFKEKGAAVVGTSSMSQEELKSKRLPAPDFQMDKVYDCDGSLAGLKENIIIKLKEKNL